MKNLSTLLFLFVLTALMAGCKDDDDTEPTKEQIISGKNWHITSLMATTGLSPSPVEAIGYLPTCQTDNFLTFETNGKVTHDEGPTKCIPAAAQTKQGNYSISGDILTLDGTILSSFGLGVTTSKNFTIEELTDETLEITLNEVITLPGGAIPIPITKTTITFTAQ